MELISIVIPVYNVENYLRECLDSVVTQDYVDIEVILVNDGSTDSSASICEEYASKFNFIKVIHKPNGGLSSARNTGIEQAKGKWIIFLDSDDVWADKRTLTKLHDYAVSFNLDILKFEYQEVDECLKPFESRAYNKSIIEGCVIDNYSLVKNAIAGEWFAVLFFLRRDIIANIRFNENTRFQEDIDFYCRLFAERTFRCGYLNDKLYLYRKRTESITTTCKVWNLKGSFDLCDVFYNSGIHSNDKNLKQLYTYYSVMMYYWTLQTLASMPYYPKRKSIIEELQLNELHKRTISRLSDAGIKRKYTLFINPAPHNGVVLLHLKDKIRSLFP